MGIIKLKEYNRIWVVDSFYKELRILLSGYGKAKEFYVWFDTRLKMLDAKDLNVISEFPKQFETIKNQPGIYCITYRNRQKNIRVLFTIDKTNNRVLLYPFNERRKNDYINALKIANYRMGGY